MSTKIINQSRQSELQMLQSLHKSIADTFEEQCWTFQYNKITKQLDLVQKVGPTCRTRYCSTKLELLEWYRKTLYDISDPNFVPQLVDYTAVFSEYAEYYGIGYDEYITLLTETVENIFSNNPEYLI
jgi:hypothetical protein